jgi:acyl carrier protein
VDADEIETVIVELLAEDAGTTVAAQVAALEDGGSTLPIDSLLLVEIVQVLEDRVGIRVPEDLETAKTMGSVRAFAQHLASIATPAGAQ